MSHRPITLLLSDIIESIEKIERYVSALSYDGFIADEKTIDAVVRNLEIIGEASNRLPESFQAQHPEIEWRRIVGLRNRIVHAYFGLDLEIIWEILQNELPVLKTKISAIKGTVW
ncbi:MAG: DUF86 domain-containing protein [Deltaproteobacteria bacterium]|nr:MAG: DUF86 domain-containing protein [Deltaproteobacteria bacterium]